MSTPTPISSRQIWLRHGFFNTLEHALTRGSDAFIALILLWTLNSEVFSKLALAQALVQPLLLIFISPETSFYRDYGRWEAQGASALATRLKAFRLFAWGKAQLALVLAFALPLVLVMRADGADTQSLALNYWSGFWALVWAFSLVLSPQISGADREFLRLSLRLRALNAVTFFQKLSLLVGIVLSSWLWPGMLAPLALASAVSTILTAVLARVLATRACRHMGASPAALAGREGPGFFAIIAESVKDFSLWNHVSGVLSGWVLTMDLFYFGVYRLPAHEVGLYAAVLKFSNFTYALPTALSNLFGIWLGRRAADAQNKNQERQKLWQLSGAMALISAVQALVLYLLAPFIFNWLSHGRWSSNDIQQMQNWFGWLLAAAAVTSSGYVIAQWLAVRISMLQYLLRVTLPWSLITCALYAITASVGGLNMTAPMTVVAAAINVLAVLSLWWTTKRL